MGPALPFAREESWLPAVMTSAQVGHALAGLGQKLVEQRLRRRGRIGAIEDVPRNHQGIDFFSFQGVQQPAQELRMLKAAVVLIQTLAEMPV
jgi:hypothetical protein